MTVVSERESPAGAVVVRFIATGLGFGFATGASTFCSATFVTCCETGSASSATSRTITRMNWKAATPPRTTVAVRHGVWMGGSE